MPDDRTTAQPTTERPVQFTIRALLWFTMETAAALGIIRWYGDWTAFALAGVGAHAGYLLWPADEASRDSDWYQRISWVVACAAMGAIAGILVGGID